MKQKKLLINLLSISSLHAYKSNRIKRQDDGATDILEQIKGLQLTTDDWKNWDDWLEDDLSTSNDASSSSSSGSFLDGYNFGGLDIATSSELQQQIADQENQQLENQQSSDPNEGTSENQPSSTESQPKKDPTEPAKNTEEHQVWAANKVKQEIKDPVILNKIDQVMHVQTNVSGVDPEKKLKKFLFLGFTEKLTEFTEKIDQKIKKNIQSQIKSRSSLGASNNYQNSVQAQQEIDKLQEQKSNALSTIPYLLEKIWDYGCWCYFGEHRYMAQGLPQNRMDKACKALNLCYECTQLDYKKEGNTMRSCEAGSVTYNRPTASINGELTQDIQCEKANEGNNCKINTCKCETQFISTIIDFFFDVDYNFEPQYQQKEGFDYDGKCVKIAPPGLNRNLLDEDKIDEINGIGNGYSNFDYNYNRRPANKYRTCCGEFPHRIPYNTKTQQCCYREEAEDNIPKIFLGMKAGKKLVCCENGKVKEEGKCEIGRAHV